MAVAPILRRRPFRPKTRWKTGSSVTESKPLSTSSKMANFFREYTARAIDCDMVSLTFSSKYRGLVADDALLLSTTQLSSLASNDSRVSIRELTEVGFKATRLANCCKPHCVERRCSSEVVPDRPLSNPWCLVTVRDLWRRDFYQAFKPMSLAWESRREAL